jgi:hypothetical protein
MLKTDWDLIEQVAAKTVIRRAAASPPDLGDSKPFQRKLRPGKLAVADLVKLRI